MYHVSMGPPIRYVRSGDARIAYEVFGEGPRELVLVPGWVSHLELAWEDPRQVRFLNRLGSFARVSGRAGPGEVLVTRTVKDLVAGSGIGVQSRGVQELPGVPGSWELLEAL